jgi:hypothetical protein
MRITISPAEPRVRPNGTKTRLYLFTREDGSVIGTFVLMSYCAALLLNAGEVNPDHVLTFAFGEREVERGTAESIAELAGWKAPIEEIPWHPKSAADFERVFVRRPKPRPESP